MKFFCIIPARGGSKGIKNKNIIKINNHPLIAYSICRSIETPEISKTIVSTDSNLIKTISRNYGAEVILRPENISQDYSKTEEAVKHAYEKVIEKPDFFVLLQPTSPLRKKGVLSDAINFLLNNNSDSLLSSRKVEGFLWRRNKSSFLPINYDYNNRPMRQEIKEEYFEENGSIYIFKPSLLNNMNSRIGGKIINFLMSEESSLQIDYKKDIQKIEKIVSNNFDYQI